VGLLIAAAITTAITLAGVAFLLRGSHDWRPLGIAFLIALPLQPLAIYLVRLPLDGFLRTTWGIAGWVTIASLFYAALTEEPAKWLTMAAPPVRRAVTVEPVRCALVAGAGFGLGEIGFLAQALVASPGYPDLPFWMFSGFILERLAVCFMHGAFLVPPFIAFARGGSFILGGLIGMTLHFFLNFPIYLHRHGVVGRAAWTTGARGVIRTPACRAPRRGPSPPRAPACRA
jgi:RsiW-degrading membrane proteinase PrsW (M82 family)